MRNWWERFQVWLRVVWPVWFATLMVAGVSLALQTTQGRDMLSHVASRSFFSGQQFRVYADSCGLKTAFLGNGGRNAATIFSLRYSSSR